MLVSIEAIGFGTIPVILRYILIGTINNNTATFTLPTADTFIGDFDIPNTMPTEIPKNFAIDLREVTRVGVVFDNVSYEGSNNNSLDPIFLSAGTASLIFTVFTPVGVKDINFYYLKGITPRLDFITYSTVDNVNLFSTSQTYGEPSIINMNSSTRISTSTDIEILFTNTTNLRNNLYYAYGTFWTVLPIDIPLNAIPLISVLSPDLSNLSRFPNLYIFTTVV